ncbi:MAG TPA: HYR domain-containing protein, partial [Gaiellaceae bacterium]|nr:HYR domain-containing protein [Gaiellaceae bacterium]
MAAVACLLAAPASARFLSAPYSNIQVEGNTTNGANVDLSSEGDISTCDTNTSPAFFPLGTSTVSCGDGSFTVTVVDTTPPTLSGHSDINNVQATGPGGAVVNYSLPSASDTVDPSPNVDCNPGSGSTFALGTTKVTCNATDSSGNSSNTTTFNVTVVDTTAPTIHVPSTITAQATSSSGASVSFTVTATDAVDGSDSVGCNHNSGDTFGFGTTEVDCSATDAHGNTGTGFFDVTVVDTIKPVVTVPSNISDNSPDPGGKTETFTASASDNVDGPITPTCKPASGSNFVIGTTTVTCTATDAHGNVGQASFTVTITLVDTTPPVITVPSDITVEATGPSGAAVSYSASANDNIDGTIIPTCNPASSSTFPLGTTTVTCSATDAHNNTASKTFHVTVQDTTPPTITVPANITTEATGSGGAAVTYTATSSDIVDGTKAASCSPASGSTFAIKTTTVTCNATDAHGNAATQKTFTVTVQ